MADPRTFERGVRYFSEGRVAELERRDASLAAVVRGASASYEVHLYLRDSALAFSCSCPMGAEGHLCKHAVAVGLAWLDRATREAGASGAGGGDGDAASPQGSIERWLAARAELSDLRHRLDALDKASLVELIVREAATNAELRAKLGGV